MSTWSESLLESWRHNSDVFLVSPDATLSYAQLSQQIHSNILELKNLFPHPAVFVVEAENNKETYIKFLSLLFSGSTVYLAPPYQYCDSAFLSFLGSECKTEFISWSSGKRIEELKPLVVQTSHALINAAINEKKSRFIVRTSGSTGSNYKFILHDPELFIKKYHDVGKHFSKTLAFSPAESIAGIETLLEVLTHQAQLVCHGDRLSPQLVVDLINTHEIDYLQTTPTFMNLLALSGSLGKIKPLKKIAFGSEPSQSTVLATYQKILPAVELIQTYGMSEIGIMKTISNSDNPTLFRFNEKFNQGKIVDELLEVQSMTPLISYLNHPSMTSNGWFKTEDRVEIQGEFIKVIGRKSELINMAGRKFFPSELEELVMELNGVQDVVVRSQPNEMVGHIIMAEIYLAQEMDETTFRQEFKNFCQTRIPYFMHPHKVTLTKQAQITPRFKKKKSL